MSAQMLKAVMIGWASVLTLPLSASGQVGQPPTSGYPPVIASWLTNWSRAQAVSVQETCRAEPGCDPKSYEPEARPETTFGWDGPQRVEKVADWARGPRYRVVANGRTVLMYLENNVVVGVYLITADGGRRNLCRDDGCQGGE